MALTSPAAFDALEQDLFHRCARKLHLVSRSYLEQGLHVIRSCRKLRSQVPDFDDGQKEDAFKLLRQ